MKGDRINYVVVGAFVLTMLGGMIVAIGVLTGRTGATDTYYTRYKDTTGLKFGSQVLYMGYPVGQVEEIKPVLQQDGMQFRVELSITDEFKNWNVPTDSVAQIKAAGLLAAITIDIRAGENEDALKPNDELKGLEQVDVFTAVSDAANTLKLLTETSIKPLVQNLHRYVTNFGAVLDERGGALITDLSVLARELATRAPELITKFISVSDEIKRTSVQLRAIFSEDNKKSLGLVVDNMLTASENVVSLTEEAKQQIHVLLGPDMTRKVDSALVNMSSAAANISQLSEDLNQNLKSILTPETASKVQRSLDNFSLAAANIAQLTEDLGETRLEVDRLLTSLTDTVDDNRPDLRRAVSDLRYSLQSVAQHIDAVTYNLDGTSRNMLEFSRLLRQNPGVLLRGVARGDNAATPTGISQ
jgi:phospholipid/cholesterol/gamma-HCH transport system substrate-binding protein